MWFVGWLIALTCMVVELVGGSSVDILDQNEVPLSSIVEQVCWHTAGTSKQISKVSTVAHIADYLSSLPEDHKLAACTQLYLNSINDLVNLVSISNNNVCSQEKIKAIQQFHRNYILKGSQRTGKTPKILVNFFMHYVNYITNICANETTAFLEGFGGSTSETNTEDVDKLLAEVTGRTGVSSSSSLRYSDMFLIWSMIDLLPSVKDDKIQKYLFEGDKRVVMAAKKSEAFHKMQEFCQDKVRPLYSHSLLSTLMLIDMGYYPSDSRILNQLNQNKQSRRFYELTKICDTLLPVRVVEQSKQIDSETLLMSRDEVERLDLTQSKPLPEVNENHCMSCSILDVDSLPTVSGVEASRLPKRVKSKISNRKSSMSRLLTVLIKNGKKNLSHKLRKLFSSEQLEIVDENQLDVYQVSEEYQDDYLDSSLRRSKRGLGDIMKTLLDQIYLIIGFLLYVVWAIVTILIFIPMSIFVSLIQWLLDLDLEVAKYRLFTGFDIFEGTRFA